MEPIAVQFEIGDLRVDRGQQCVHRGQTEIALSKLSFDLLIALADAAPNLVSLDQLMAQVWADLVVSPETVIQRVKLLRDALGDDPREPRYIAGLRGRGYKLLPTVRHIASPRSVPPVLVQTPVTAAMPTPVENSVSAIDTAAIQRETSATIHPRSRFGLRLPVGILILAVLAVALWPHWGHWLRTEKSRVASGAVAQVIVTGLPPRTVAVLPFDDLTITHDNAQLALGLAEMVLQRLGSVKDLLVIARSSSFSFIGQQVDAREIGHRLDARYLVEGAVQRQGDRMRVTARLIDSASGRQLRSMTFDRRVKDIFDVQDEIAGQVAAALEVQLMGADLHRIDRSRSSSLDAYLGYLKSQTLLNRWTVADAEHSVAELDRAIALDPNFALGYAELARAQHVLHFLRNEGGGEQQRATLVAKALALDPRLGEAYAIRGALDSDPAAKDADFRRAIALAPNYGPAYEMYAEALLEELNRPQEGLQMLDRAILIDPIAPRGPYIKGLYSLIDSDSTVEATKWFLKALQVDPEFAPALVRLAELKHDNGEIAEGLKLMERALRVEPRALWMRLLACGMYLDVGDRDAAASISAGQARETGLPTMLSVYDRNFAGQAVDPFTWPKDTTMMYARSIWIDAQSRSTAQITRSISMLRQELGDFEKSNEPQTNGRKGINLRLRLTHLLQRQGDKAAADRSLSKLRPRLTRNALAPAFAMGAWQMLAGEHEAAIQSLSNEIRREHVPVWWLIDRDPIWEPVRANPLYQAALEIERQRVARQRILLEQMRERGEILRRGAQVAAARGG